MNFTREKKESKLFRWMGNTHTHTENICICEKSEKFVEKNTFELFCACASDQFHSKNFNTLTIVIHKYYTHTHTCKRLEFKRI